MLDAVAGAAALMVVVLAHVAAVLHVLRWMGWGQEHSAGHYVDFVSASLGLVLFPVGYALHAFATHPSRRRGVRSQ